MILSYKIQVSQFPCQLPHTIKWSIGICNMICLIKDLSGKVVLSHNWSILVPLTVFSLLTISTCCALCTLENIDRYICIQFPRKQSRTLLRLWGQNQVISAKRSLCAASRQTSFWSSPWWSFLCCYFLAYYFTCLLNDSLNVECPNYTETQNKRQSTMPLEARMAT